MHAEGKTPTYFIKGDTSIYILSSTKCRNVSHMELPMIVSAVSDSSWFGVPSHALSKLFRNFVRCPRSLLTARHHNLFV